MRIAVRVPDGDFDEQTRAYAEFRVFSTLARFSRHLDRVAVTLTQSGADTRVVVCAVRVTFAEGARLRVTARDPHAYDAIERAVARVGDMLRGDRPLALTS